MRFSSIIILGVQVSSILALPAHSVRRNQINAVSQPVHVQQQSAESNVEAGKAEAEKAVEEAAGAEGEGGEEKAVEEEVAEGAEGEAAEGEAAEGEAAEGEAAEGEEAAAGEEEKLEGEKEIEAAFDEVVALEGGDIKQDTVFTASAIGKFEFEFQGPEADELTVTENKTPAAPPAGFIAIEPSSFQVALGVSKGANLTLSKIDYIFDPANAELAALDLTQAKVGKLCVDTGSFVIEETLGELEFEAEENEVTLNLNKLVLAEGEWGIFLPAAEEAAEGEVAEEEVAEGAEGEAAEGEAAEGEAAEGEAAGGEDAAAEEEAKLKEEEAAAEEEAKLKEEEAAKAEEEAAAHEGGAEKAEGEAEGEGEGAKAEEGANPGHEGGVGGLLGGLDLGALIDSLREGRGSVPTFVIPHRL